MPIVCQRHTTSKLRHFDDLTTIATLGFRGEALASISYISHVTITTMTAFDTQHGWKATYKDGVMEGREPRPTAATPGTIILAEDLFYNVPLRRKALKSASDEYAAILDVVGRYAVYHAGAAVAVKKGGEVKADVSTVQGGSRLDAIRAVYGVAIARHCLEIKYQDSATGGGDENSEKSNNNNKDSSIERNIRVQGYITGAEYTAPRKTQLILFINGRSVECPLLKRSVESTYATLLPNASKPFLFLDISMPPHHVDVNVHPTKKEVAFLHQDEVMEVVRAKVASVLEASHAQRTFKQTVLPTSFLLPGVGSDGTGGIGGIGGAVVPSSSLGEDGREKESQRPPAYYRPNKAVRIDAKTQTLDAFGIVSTGGKEGEDDQSMANEALIQVPARRRGRHTSTTTTTSDDAFLPTAHDISALATAQQQDPLPPPATTTTTTATKTTMKAPIRHKSNPIQSTGLQSVDALLSCHHSHHHQGIADVLHSSTFIGLADSHRVLLQSGTRLYLVDMTVFTKDMFYQQVLHRFGQAPSSIALHPAPALPKLACIALEVEEARGAWKDSEEGGTKEEVAGLLTELLKKKAGLLKDCFAIKIGTTTDVEDGGSGTNVSLCSLPQLIEQYHPPEEYLPQFILSLGQNVDWQEQESCFHGIASALSDLYCLHEDAELDAYLMTPRDGENEQESGSVEKERKRREWEVQHVLLPALKLFLKPKKERASDGTIIELTRLEQLYRVFERC